MPVTSVQDVFLQAAGGWSGCDWPTAFGDHRLNLQGLKAEQAVLLARATAGSEAADWRYAVRYLERVERDARQAEEEARAALALAEVGEWQQALAHARRACTIEARYHRKLVWQPLRDEVEAGLAAAESAAAARPDGDGRQEPHPEKGRPGTTPGPCPAGGNVASRNHLDAWGGAPARSRA